MTWLKGIEFMRRNPCSDCDAFESFNLSMSAQRTLTFTFIPVQNVQHWFTSKAQI